MKMPYILATLACGLVLVGCVSNDTGTAPGGSSGGVPRVVSISWDNQEMAGGVTNIRVQVNGTNHYIATARNFKETLRPEYASMGIPVKATLAGIFWGEGAHEEDAEGIYAAVEGGNVVVYTGYYSPGETANVEWKAKLVVPF